MLHKNPAKARFIRAFPVPSLKPLNLSITSVFKLIFKLFKPEVTNFVIPVV